MRAGPAFCGRGAMTRPGSPFSSRRPVKNAAYSQNCVRFHVAAGTVVVALGAFQLDPEEEPGGPAGQVLGLVFVGQIETRGVRIREQPADQPVVGGVRCELLAQPAFEGGDHGLRLHGGLRQQLSSPEMGEVLDVQRSVIGAVQQLVDPQPALVRASVFEEVHQLGDRGNPAFRSRLSLRKNSASSASGAGGISSFARRQADELVNPSRQGLERSCD